MKAVLLNGINNLQVGEIAEQPLGPTEVRVKVAYSGICGSDPHIIDGNLGAASTYPIIMGHEMSGTIVELGEKAKIRGLKVGDKVTGSPSYYCGTCDMCRNGKENFCEQFIAHIPPGTMAETLVWDEQQIYKLPEGISLEEGALAEPVAAALRGIERADISPGKTVCICGMGAIGLLQVQLAKLAGASKIMAVDIVDSKLELAKHFGADLAVNSMEEDILDAAMEFTDDVGFDCVIEATGVPAVAEDAFNLVARGGTVNFFAVYPMDYFFPMHLATSYFKELTVRSTFFYPYLFIKAVNLLPRLELKPLISQIFPLEQGIEAFEANKVKENIKVLIQSNPVD